MDVTLDKKYVELHGSVFVIEKIDDGYNCVIHFHHTDQTRSRICEYIARIQLQTIQELNAL